MLMNVLWEKVWIPDLNLSPRNFNDSTFEDIIPNVRSIGLESNEIPVPDPKAMRSMSRASVFASNLTLDIIPHVKTVLEVSPFDIGIYCAVENGPIDGPSTAEILKRSSGTFDAVFAEAYRKLRNPKMYLKQLPNLVPAQLGISLGIQGPMNVYTHSVKGCLQALEQAEQDLIHHKVKMALVITAHAFDDFWVVKRTRLQDQRVLCEGAAAQLLTLGNKKENSENEGVMKKSINREYYYDNENYFGISDPLINLIRKKSIQ